MKKILIFITLFMFILSKVHANDQFILRHYPVLMKNDCRLMISSQDAFCIDKVIRKDFRKSRDNLYYVVLGRNEDDCHLCNGVVDIYALTPKGKLISQKGLKMGSWGKVPDDWKFVKQKNGKMQLSVMDCFTSMGQVDCITSTFFTKGNKFLKKKS